MAVAKQEKIAYISEWIVPFNPRYLHLYFNFKIYYFYSTNYNITIDILSYDRFLTLRRNDWRLFVDDYEISYNKNIGLFLRDLGVELLLLTPNSPMFEDPFLVQEKAFPYVIIPNDIMDLIHLVIFSKRAALPTVELLLP